MSEDTTDNQKKQKTLRTKAFWIAFEMIFVFGVPAALAILFGEWLTGEMGMESWVTYFLLVLAFITSWVIVYYRVRWLAKEMDKAHEEEGKDQDKDNM